MKLYYLVEVDTNAPPEKYAGVGISVARALWRDFGAQARVAQIRDVPDGVRMHNGTAREVFYDPILDDGHEPPNYKPRYVR